MRAPEVAGPDCRLARGYSLLEVLIALVVLSIGLLGLAGLQHLSLQRNQSAYHRTVATLLAYDIADRMRANRVALSSYVLSPPASSASAPQDCESAACTPAQLAAFDLSRWLSEMGARLPAAKGEITQNGNEFTIKVLWDDTREGLTGTTCSGAATDMKCFKLVFQP